MLPEVPPHHQGCAAALPGGDVQNLIGAAEQAEHHGVIGLLGRQVPDVPGQGRQPGVMAPGGQVGDGRRGAVYGGDVSAVGQKGPAQQTQAAPGVAHPVLRVQERPQLPGQVRIVAAAVRRRVQIADDLRTPSLHGSPPFFRIFYHTIPPPGMQAGGRMMGDFEYVLQFYGRNIRNAIEFGGGGGG